MEVNEPNATYLLMEAWSSQILGDFAKSISSGRSSADAERGEFDVYGSTGVIGRTNIATYEGDAILVARVGANAGTVNTVHGRYGVTDNTIIIRVSDEVSLPFVAYQLKAANLNSMVFGSGQPLITGSQLKGLRISLPKTRGEQNSIARTLADADALIDSLEQLLTKKRQIKQGAMQELLTGKRRLPGFKGPWIKRAFDEVATLSRERVNPSGLGKPPLCVELEHLQSSTGRLSGEAFESQQAATKTVFRKGDVLFGKLRAYLRKYWLAEFDGVCSTEIWVLRPRGELASNAYLFYTIQRDDFIEAASTAYGTHMPRSDWKIVSGFDLSLPGDSREQTAIASALSDMDAAITALEARLTKARALKQAMAQALLTGRIRLVEPTE